jgi:hypothetical protein
MSTMILHCGGEMVTREQVDLVWKPEATATYQPIAHGDVVDLAKEVVDYRLGYKLRSEQYGLNKDGAQFFFALTYDTGTDQGFTIAGRNSYDKSLKVAYVGGARVFVCDNLALRGDALHVQRKHTKNVMRDIHDLCDGAVQSGVVAARSLADLWQQMRLYTVDLDRGYEIMGRALGHDVIKPQQITLAMDAWNEDLHGFGRSLYGVYQAFTEGCKRGAPALMIDRLTDVNDFMIAELERARGGAPRLTDAGEQLLAARPTLEID